MVSTFPPQAPPREQANRSELASRFAATGYAALQNICGEAKDEVMILTGTVPSYYLKQVAQTIAGSMEGIKRVENRLEVHSPC